MTQDEVAVITGAASGIGAGLARVACQRGLRLVLADSNKKALDRLVASLPCDALAVEVDVADPGSVQALADASYAAFGRVDLLFNNAGVLLGGRSWELATADWRKVLEVNVMGVVHGVRCFVPTMIAEGRPARVINTASVGGLLAGPMIAPYSASKFAVVAMSEALEVELQLAAAPVRVSLLAPGPVRTGIFDMSRVSTASEADQAIERMRGYTESEGIDADELARRAFAGIDAGQFWLITQPETCDEPLRARTERIAARRNPNPADYGIGFQTEETAT